MIQARPMRPGMIVGFLIAVGFVRGVLDVPWIYWQAGNLPWLPSLLGEPTWYVVNIGPFVSAQVLTALLRWVLFAAIVYGLGRFLGGRGSHRVTLNFYGAVLGITVVTIVIDYVHLLLPLPLIRFAGSPQYNPIIGIGQVATAVWIGYVTYLLARREYRLARWPALMVGSFVPLLNTGLFLIVVRVFFRFLPEDLPQGVLALGLNLGFLALGLLALAALLSWSWRSLRPRDPQAIAAEPGARAL